MAAHALAATRREGVTFCHLKGRPARAAPTKVGVGFASTQDDEDAGSRQPQLGRTGPGARRGSRQDAKDDLVPDLFRCWHEVPAGRGPGYYTAPSPCQHEVPCGVRPVDFPRPPRPCQHAVPRHLLGRVRPPGRPGHCGGDTGSRRRGRARDRAGRYRAYLACTADGRS